MDLDFEKPRVKSSLSDQAALKRNIDDVVCKFFEAKGFAEDHTHNNVKIIMSVIACVFGLVAQFYPKPFPDNKLLLLTCVAGYFISTSLLTLYFSLLDARLIYVSKTSTDDNYARRFPDGVSISSEIPKTSATLTLHFESNSKKTDKHSKKVQITKFYDVNGVMLYEPLLKFIDQEFEAFDRKKAK